MYTYSNNRQKYSTSSPRQFWQSRTPESFAVAYSENFDFQNSLSLGAFKNWGAEEFFSLIGSTSALRKVYDSYLDIYQKENATLHIDIWLAKIAYQESRKILPLWFAEFLNTIYQKVGKDGEKFKDFLEVFVAYHKFFNPRAN